VWLGHSEAVPQTVKSWGFAALSRQPPSNSSFPLELVSVIVDCGIKDKTGSLLVSVAGPIIPILTIRQDIRANLCIIEEKTPDNSRAPCLW
jgi:hypothetical protein